MAYISFQPRDFFNTLLYTGGSGFTAFTGLGFQPDHTWHKDRTSGVNWWGQCDSVRGVNQDGKDCVAIYSNDASAQGTDTTSYLNGYQADGFTAGNNGSFGSDGYTYASWCWKAGTAHSGATTGSGTPKTYTASVNTTSGFSITEYGGNGTTGHTIPHNLGVVPEFIIVKDLASNAWQVYNQNITKDYILVLNTTAAQANETNRWNAEPTSTVFELGDSATVNGNGNTYISYAFAPIKGYSKFGIYEGNTNLNGPFIHTGFRPSTVMFKNIDRVEAWKIYDTKRSPFNVTESSLNIDDTAAENTSTAIKIDILSNGFKIRTTSTEINTSTCSYMAFAEFPIVSSNSKPTVAR